MTATRAVAERLQFRGNLSAPAVVNSGGNQQKLVIGKWVLTAADVLIFDEPTRGIDVGAKAEIYRLIHELASNAMAIIIISSEIVELTNLCHRIIVMSGGRIHDELPAAEFDEHRILSCSLCAQRWPARPERDQLSTRCVMMPIRYARALNAMHSGPGKSELVAHPSVRAFVDGVGTRIREIGLPVVVLLLVVIFSFSSDVFFTPQKFAQHRGCSRRTRSSLIRTNLRCVDSRIGSFRWDLRSL